MIESRTIRGTVEDWLAVMGPPSLAAPQVAYWERLLERATGHAEWKQFLEVNANERDFRNARETRDFLKSQYARARALLADLGMLK